MEKIIHINKNFGQSNIDLRNYRLVSFGVIDILVSKEISPNGETVRVDYSKLDSRKINKTLAVIRQLKSNEWDICWVPECIFEFLAKIEPTAFVRVKQIMLYDDKGNLIVEDKNE